MKNEIKKPVKKKAIACVVDKKLLKHMSSIMPGLTKVFKRDFLEAIVDAEINNRILMQHFSIDKEQAKIIYLAHKEKHKKMFTQLKKIVSL